MPSYPGALTALAPVSSNVSGFGMNPGDSVYLFGVAASGITQLPIDDHNVDFETVAALTPSISACISGRKEAGSAPAVSMEVIFNGNPGAFSLQLQEASTDADGHYLTPSAAAFTITTATKSGSNYYAYVDDIPTGGKFLRAYLASLANVVKMQVKLTLLA